MKKTHQEILFTKRGPMYKASPQFNTLKTNHMLKIKNTQPGDFPGGAMVKNPPAGLPWWRSG